MNHENVSAVCDILSFKDPWETVVVPLYSELYCSFMLVIFFLRSVPFIHGCMYD